MFQIQTHVLTDFAGPDSPGPKGAICPTTTPPSPRHPHHHAAALPAAAHGHLCL